MGTKKISLKIINSSISTRSYGQGGELAKPGITEITLDN